METEAYVLRYVVLCTNTVVASSLKTVFEKTNCWKSTTFTIFRVPSCKG